MQILPAALSIVQTTLVIVPSTNELQELLRSIDITYGYLIELGNTVPESDRLVKLATIRCQEARRRVEKLLQDGAATS